MIAVIGIGGAGGNIADVASQKGFATGAINFSQKDLESAENVKNKLRLVGSEGVGHNRDEAIRLMQDNWELALNFIKENFSNPSIEVIIIPFSSGGGSGSGISPILLDILSNEMPDKVFVAMPIIPDTSEVVTSQLNCIATFEELSKLDISVFPADNQKVKNKLPHVGKDKVWESTNNSVISLFSELFSYTQKFSKNGNLDRRDLKTLLGTKGIGMISETPLTRIGEEKIDISSEGFTNIIHRSWEQSIFVSPEKKHIVRSGIVFDGQQQLMQHIKYEDIFNVFENGMPLDLFEGNYHGDEGKVLTILTGLPWCNIRLSQIDNIVEEKKQSIESVLTDNENQSYQSKVSDFTSKVRLQPKKIKSVTDILSKYKR
jgi:hypothetical protein